jgi:hypothetical protein
MLRDRLLAPLRERFLPFLRRNARLSPREQAAVAVALLAFLLVAARRYRGWL